MGSKWRKVKQALGLNLCLYAPKTHVVDDNDDNDDGSSYQPPSERRSDAALLPPAGEYTSAPSTLASNRPRLSLSKSLSRSSSTKTCSICLGSMMRGQGQALFTAECSHSFHFHCIASNVKHGNRICPVCRSKWKEIPLQALNNNPKPRIDPRARRSQPVRSYSTRNPSSLIQAHEPPTYNDDDPLGPTSDRASKDDPFAGGGNNDDRRRVGIETYTEVSSVLKSRALDSFAVLVHLRAPCSNSWLRDGAHNGPKLSEMAQAASRAPVDLVTVLDTSGSMAGTKLALLIRAVGFVIRNLGPDDRLSVVVFSSSARRLFPLRAMSESGKQQVLQSVNSLSANGGTNIAEGLRKGAKVMEDRRHKNPVSSIILLSDGHDTYSVSNNFNDVRNYDTLLPPSGFDVPVHTFGFGSDHDPLSMHSISEVSCGTFSFIENEAAIQDAFAQCIGGLLSVVVKGLELEIESAHPKIRIAPLKSGSYPNRPLPDRASCVVEAGDLYADEERDFLVSINLPPVEDSLREDETSLLRIKCSYRDPLSEEPLTSDDVLVKIKRTDAPTGDGDAVSIEVDRQQNRVRAAEAMSEARALAENGDLSRAVSVLGSFRKILEVTASAKSRDGLCLGLDAEVGEMQERLKSRQAYEASGRAYLLSGLSSHSWQRATAWGESGDGSGLVRAYQTPSMVEMVRRSQAAVLGGSPLDRRFLRPVRSFGSQPGPRCR